MGSVRWTHHTVLFWGRIGMAGEVNTMMVVRRIPIRTHMHIATLGCCPQRLQCMEALVVVVVHAIVTAVCLNGNLTQTHESSHRQDRSGTAATSTHRPRGKLVHGQRTVLAGEPWKLAR
jgi:hypothetical protein